MGDLLKDITDRLQDGRIKEPTGRGGEPIEPYEDWRDEPGAIGRGDKEGGSVPETIIK